MENSTGQNLKATTSNYFPEGPYPENSFNYKLKKAWNMFLYYARQVWPWIYRLLNFIVYNTLKVLKAIVRIGMEQLHG